jgi:hypothetical protein
MFAYGVLAAASPPVAKTHGTNLGGWIFLLAVAAVGVWLLWRRKQRAGGRASAHAASDAAAHAAGGVGGAGKGGDSRTSSALQVFVVLDRESLPALLASGRSTVELQAGGAGQPALLSIDPMRSSGDLGRGEGAVDCGQLGQRGVVYQLGPGASNPGNRDRSNVSAVVPSGGDRRAADGIDPMTCPSPGCTFAVHHLGPCSWSVGAR